MLQTEVDCIVKVKREAMVSAYLTDALLILMREKKYRDISITGICKKAGVTRMSFYRNYESKEDILKKWIASVTEDFLEESGISYKNDSSRDYFVKLFTHLQRYREISVALYRADLIHLVREQFDKVFLRLHADEYDPYKSYFLSGGIYNVFLLWLMNGCAETPEELAERMEGLLTK